MRELKRRQADAFSEARSIEKSWITALGRWESQLGKARATAVYGEIREFQILQREDLQVGVLRAMAYPPESFLYVTCFLAVVLSRWRCT